MRNTASIIFFVFIGLLMANCEKNEPDPRTIWLNTYTGKATFTKNNTILKTYDPANVEFREGSASRLVMYLANNQANADFNGAIEVQMEIADDNNAEASIFEQAFANGNYAGNAALGENNDVEVRLTEVDTGEEFLFKGTK